MTQEMDLFEQAAQLLIDTANKTADPMESLRAFHSYTRNGMNLNITCHHSKDLDEKTMDWIVKTTETNMRQMYESCQWGWNEKEKRDELSDPLARYIIVRDDAVPVAFVHFRFDHDDGREVLYCYEIQLIEKVRRKGLGRFLIQILELMANKFDMMKVILTTFRHNKTAVEFFQNMKYTLDDTSPCNKFYMILSKPTLKWKKIGQACRQ